MEVSVLSHVTNSALVVYTLQFLKGTVLYRRFAAWLPLAESQVHVLMSAIGAGATALGMHGAAQGSSTEGWVITLMIPPVWVVAHAAWDLAQQMALNQIIFAVAVQQKAAAPVMTVPLGHPAPAAGITVTTPLEDPR